MEASASQSLVPPSPFVSVTVTEDPGAADVALTDNWGSALVTVTVGLVAALVYPLLRNSRNSYVPGVSGIAMVHVFVVTPAPT